MLKLIDFDLDFDNLSPEVAEGVSTLKVRRYHKGRLRNITKFKGLTVDDEPVYRLSGKRGLYTYSDLRKSHVLRYDAVIIATDNEPTGILYGIENEQTKIRLW
jgi:hypothetical protein